MSAGGAFDSGPAGIEAEAIAGVFVESRWRVAGATIVVGMAGVMMAAGCRAPLSEQPVGVAEPIVRLEGYVNVFRDGEILFAGQPTVDALREAGRSGVKVVVNLRSDAEMASHVDFDEPEVVGDAGMKYVQLPVTPATLSAADADALSAVLSATPGPVLVHCASSNRVGGLWALYLHRHRGVPFDRAMELGECAGMRSPALALAVQRAAGQ